MTATPPHARVYIVRHGETDANRQGIIQGQLDTALNDVGMEQARLVAEALKGERFDKALSSDLSRAANTAEVILAHHPEVLLDKRVELRERYLGKLQGTKRLSQFKSDETMETKAEFTRRAISWWNSIVEYLASLPSRGDRAYHVLVTSHGGFIGTLIDTLVASQRIGLQKGVVVGECMNASVSVIELGDGGVLVKFGEVGHLRGTVTATNADFHTAK